MFWGSTSIRKRWTLSTRGEVTLRHVAAETVAEEVKANRLEATTDFARVDEVEAVIICVPTPLNKNREPDISYIAWSISAVLAPHSCSCLQRSCVCSDPWSASKTERSWLATRLQSPAGQPLDEVPPQRSQIAIRDNRKVWPLEFRGFESVCSATFGWYLCRQNAEIEPTSASRGRDRSESRSRRATDRCSGAKPRSGYDR